MKKIIMVILIGSHLMSGFPGLESIVQKAMLVDGFCQVEHAGYNDNIIDIHKDGSPLSIEKLYELKHEIINNVKNGIETLLNEKKDNLISRRQMVIEVFEAYYVCKRVLLYQELRTLFPVSFELYRYRIPIIIGWQ